jgi:dolichol-phosphate mannosyltransferase
MSVLVFFPTYNEAGNARSLIEGIWEHLPEAHILVVDDASPDGTGALLDELAVRHQRLKVIHRPRKMGVGSAHKLAFHYARDHEFDILITMDADFSHHPRYLPRFIEHLQRSDFVTGSRYMEGGGSNHGFYRALLSRTANAVAKRALGLPLAENTTLYRGYTLPLLRRLDIDRIKSEGYSFAVESLFRISRLAGELSEFPIYFENRLIGTSKISKVEIYRAVVTVLSLLGRRLSGTERELVASLWPPEPVVCASCGGTYQVEVYPAREPAGAGTDISRYSCSSRSARSHGQIVRCLQCGLTFMKPKLSPQQLLKEYARVEDPSFVDDIHARERMFERNLSRLRHYVRPGERWLDVGSYCGAFLAVARRQGLEAVGVEPGRWAVEQSSRRTEARVYPGTLDDLPADIGRFDAVTLWDVLEHLSDPVGELKKVHGLLKTEGTLMLSTLMIDNWFARLLGSRWPWLMDMHLFYFTDATIARVLEQAGFAIIESFDYCHMVTLRYLLSKLDTIGFPGAGALAASLGQSPPGEAVLAFSLGDIKLLVCKKRA